MPQVQGQYQVQSEAQLQKLSPLQLMTTRLLELSVVELEQRVKDESIENFALETDRTADNDDAAMFDSSEGPSGEGIDEFDGEDNEKLDEMDERVAFMDTPSSKET